MNREELDPIQSYVEYVHKERNSTNKTNITKSSSEDDFYKKLKEINDKKEEEKKVAERLQTEFQINNFVTDLNRRAFETQMNMVWDQMPEGAREEARFRAALNPNPIEIEPKNVSYEDAKNRFDEYDYYVNNPITYREFLKKNPKDPLSISWTKPKSLDDYMIFTDPTTEGYIRPRTEIENEGLSRRVYNQELTTSLAEYNRRQSENIDLETIVDSTWDNYLNNFRVNPKKHKDGWLTRNAGSVLDWITEAEDDALNAIGINIKQPKYSDYVQDINLEYANDAKIKRDSLINTSLDTFYDSHNSHVRPYDTFNKRSPIIHSANITSNIVASFPKDKDGNILINGEAFPEYFVYQQIFGITANKFGEHLLKDAEESANGLGRVYLDDFCKKEYGMPYDDYMQDVFYNRTKEIRDRLEVLGKKMAESEKTEGMSNSIQQGFNDMGVMLPRKLKESIADSYAKGYTTHPFENAVEELDATLSAIEGGKFSKGFISGFDWMNMASLGFSEVGGDFTKLQVLEKVNEGKSLTEDEKYIYELFQLEEELKGLYKGMNIKQPAWADIGSGVGQFVADMPMFAASMGATGGIGAGVKYGTKFALKKYLKKKTFSTAMNLVKRSAIDFSKMYAVNFARGAVAAPFMSITYKSYANKALNQYSFDENGNLKYNPKSKWAMAAGAYLEGTNEIASEYWGGAFDDAISLGSKAFGRATGISKWLNKSEVGTWMRRVSQAPMSDATKKTLRNLGYTGILSEPLSEVWGDVMTNTELMFLDNTVNLINDGKNFEWKKDGRYFDTGYSFEEFSNPDYWITIMGVSTISGGAMTSVAAGRNIVQQANYAKKLTAERNQFLKYITNKELRNTLSLLGNSDNFINSAIELADFNWDNVSAANKADALNYMRRSYVLQTTMGDMESQRHMMSFEDTVNHYYNREFTSKGKHTGRMYTAFDAQGNTYNILNVEEKTEDGSIKSYRVIDDAGNISIKLDSELFGVQEELIDNIIAEEYNNTFSSEIESTRLNNVRQAFERTFKPEWANETNPESKIYKERENTIRRLTSEFGIRKPEVGKTVKLVDGTEATIKEDLKNGNYIIERYNPETTEKEDIEIPVHSILSNNPVTAAAQKKMLEDTKAVQESGNPSIVPESHKSSEDKVNDIINADYDSRLFDDKGVVKLDNQQIINNFSLEDPASLEDYINKVGNRVSPQVRQSLNNALKLSKIHNEINPQLSHLVQTSKNRTDVAILSNVLSQEIITSDPNITAEELLESIINNSNYNSKIRHDFKSILKALTNTKVQQKTTTKTKTSVTQKDVKGKRGRKTIESSLERFRQAVKQDNIVKALYEINFIDETRKKTDDIIIADEELNELEEARKTFKERGYKIKSLKGTNYHEGQTDVLVEEFIRDQNLPAGTEIVTEVITPAIYKDGQLYKAGKVKVAMGPAIEEETPDISQAVTKEMTENEPMDFSEPTDNTVEPKKEDSIPQDTTEQEFTIPELERAFAIPDSDKLIETPSREEEIETLTDEQRNQVRIHNENGTDLIDPISDSALPDDPSTDEVIVDKHELQGNRIYRYNGEQLRNNQAQVRRIPKKEGDNHDLVYKWLDENSIDLQGIIDNELAAIAALDTDVKFMMITEGTKSGHTSGSPMLNTVFQVVEYTDAIKKIHNEKRGGVITSNGKEYLLIGITGFSTPKPGIFNPEAAHYNFMADKVLKSARNNYTSQTNEISRDAYYVHPTMSTKIKNIEAGWIVTQTTEDSEKQSRSLGELLADETRNPHGITAENSKWLIPTRNSAKPIKIRVDANDTVHGLKVHTGLAGSLFLLVPAANGHYIPVSVKIQTTNELADGTLKDNIWKVAQNLLSTEKEIRDYAIKELCKLLNLTKEGYNILIDDKYIDFDNSNNAKIVFYKNGKRTGTEVSLSSPNKTKELFNAIFSIPFQLNIGLQTLVSGELQAYIDAGALITDAALLGTTNASYTVHSIGPDLKADPYTENSTESQEGSYENSDLRRTQDNGIINYGNNSYFRMAEDQYVNTKTGELVTDVKTIREIKTHVWLEKSKPTPAKIEQGSKAKLYIIGENEVISVSKNGIITFYSAERSIDIIDEINRENTEESRINNAVEELARIEEQQQAEQVIQQELQEEKDASVSDVNFTENFDVFNTPEVSPVEDSFTEVSFEETSSPKEEVSATFTEGVVENTDASQLYIDDYLGNIEEQLIAEGMSEEEINAFMDKILLQLEEQGMGTYYTKEQESIIKTIVDNIKNCH
jgi:hypothetical protein